MTQALSGIRVLDCTVMQQGPAATVLMADMGAEVIKIEQRGVGDHGRSFLRVMGQPTGKGDRNFYFEAYNRNKKSLAIDLKQPLGLEVMYRLVEKSDVLVHNFRQNVPKKLGLDYDTLSKRNPRIIYACASGLGPAGKDNLRPYNDAVALARTGFMDLAASPEGPPGYIPGGIADQSGAFMLFAGILTALVARERQGIGQKVDTSLLGTMMWLQGQNTHGYLMTSKQPMKHRRSQPNNPLFNYYECSDGRWFFIANWRVSDWRDVCLAIDRPELEHEANYETEELRRHNSEELTGLLARVFASRTLAEWVERFKNYPDLTYERVARFTEIADDPQVLANEYVVNFPHPAWGDTRVLGLPIKLSRTPGEIRSPAPELGQHTEEVLMEVGGYNWDDISRFKELEII